MKILLTEDEETIRHFYLRELSKHFDVTEDTTEEVDIAILDVNMHGHLMSKQELMNIKTKKIIIFSNYPEYHIRKRYKDIEIHDCLLKISYTPASLVEYLKKI